MWKIRLLLAGWLVLLSVSLLRMRGAKMVVCDVGQGDAILFTNGSVQLLVDTGNKEARVLACLSRHIPFWDKNIEGVVISHEDEDHSGGLIAIAIYYRINTIFGGLAEKGDSEQILYTARVGENDFVRVGEFVIDIASPSVNEKDGNNLSLVGLLHYRNKSVWLAGDAEKEVEERLVWQGKLARMVGDSGVDILKVSHHGSAGASSEEFVKLLGPKTAVVSVGRGNRFGHPASETLERLQEAGALVRRTDEEGEVVIELGR